MKPFRPPTPFIALGAGLSLGAGLPTALGAGLPTSPHRSTAGLQKCGRPWPRWETFGRLAVRGRRPSHSGFTLVEMLLVVTVLAFLLACVALAIGTLFRAQGELQDELAQAHIASRLAAQLRADAHLASSAEVVQDADTTNVRLSLPNATINYATQPRRIIRTVTQGETEAHREVFSLLEGTTADWDLSAEPPAFITLTISYRSPDLRAGVARPREQRVETSIGLHAGGVK